MSEDTTPGWFKGAVYAAIAWNLIGVMQYLAHVSTTPEQLAALPMAQRDLLMAMPAWVDGAFAVAVFAGTIGSILLLLKKAWALHLFLLSMLGVLVQNYYSFVMSDAIEVMGSAAIVVPAVVFTIGVLLIWLSVSAKSKGWIG
jgi:hypothetical protein